MGDANRYFASLPDAEIGAALVEKVAAYRKWCNDTGQAARWVASARAYYGLGEGGNSSDLSLAGNEGELIATKVNHFRKLAQQTLVLTTSQKPAMSAISSNTDFDSLAQTMLATGLIDYYWREKRLERGLRASTESAIVCSEGSIAVEWDVSAGKEVAADLETGMTENEGDLTFTTLTPFDVSRDTGVNRAEDSQWVIIEKRGNKYDLAARYPEKAELLTALVDEAARPNSLRIADSGAKSDQVSVYTFFHGISPAMPQGRMVQYVNKDIVLFSGPLPYDKLPVYRIAPGEQMGAPLGYTTMFDLLGPQKGVDMLTNIPLSNQNAFGVQTVLVPRKANLSKKDLGKGLSIIEFDGEQKPEPLQLTATPAEIFPFREALKSDMGEIAGINSASLGEPKHEMAGVALALLASQSITYNSHLQASYAALLEDVGTAIIQTLKRYANTERVATIAGKADSYAVQSFSAKDIEGVERVTVEIVNPLMKTQQGRLSVAQMLLEGGHIDSTQFLTFVNTGKLETMFEGKQANLMRIRKDKEGLQKGVEPIALICDTHWLDIPEYLSVLAMPDARTRENVVTAVLSIVQKKLDMWRTMDPALLALLGGPPAPMPGMPAGTPAPVPGGASGTKPPGGGSASSTPPVTPGPTDGPRMPIDPTTGDQFIPPGANTNLQ